MNVSLDKPANHDNPCTAARFNMPVGGSAAAQVPALHQFNGASC